MFSEFFDRWSIDFKTRTPKSWVGGISNSRVVTIRCLDCRGWLVFLVLANPGVCYRRCYRAENQDAGNLLMVSLIVVPGESMGICHSE